MEQFSEQELLRNFTSWLTEQRRPICREANWDHISEESALFPIVPQEIEELVDEFLKTNLKTE